MLHTKNEFAKTYSRNVYSQNGEDGILEEICKRLNLTPAWVCEFGAWDGIHLSNTFQFIEKGTKAVLIEGDAKKYQQLLETVEKHPSIVPICSMVSYTQPDSLLDALLQSTPVPTDFDILSIDVDGEDYHIWATVEKYTPKIVIIEVNSLVHPDNKEHIHSTRFLGTGFGAMLELGQRKGYSLVCHTGNMIFVRSDLFPMLGISYEHPSENFDASWYNKTR